MHILPRNVQLLLVSTLLQRILKKKKSCGDSDGETLSMASLGHINSKLQHRFMLKKKKKTTKEKITRGSCVDISTPWTYHVTDSEPGIFCLQSGNTYKKHFTFRGFERR